MRPLATALFRATGRGGIGPGVRFDPRDGGGGTSDSGKRTSPGGGGAADSGADPRFTVAVGAGRSRRMGVGRWKSAGDAGGGGACSKSGGRRKVSGRWVSTRTGVPTRSAPTSALRRAGVSWNWLGSRRAASKV